MPQGNFRFALLIFYLAWMGQELLTTFENEIGELALIPGGVGIFTVKAGDGK